MGNCIPYIKGEPYKGSLKDLAKEIAEQYHSLKDDKNNPLVKAVEAIDYINATAKK